MSYRLNPEDPSVADAVRRIALERIHKAVGVIDDVRIDRDKTVHDVRKRCKELRGLVRLVKPGFPGAKSENRAFRDAAKAISGQRDAAVMADTFRSLTQDGAGHLHPHAVFAIRRALDTEKKRVTTPAYDDDPLHIEVRPALMVARQRAKEWTFKDGGWTALEGGFEETYDLARQAMKKALPKGDNEKMHEWRKQAKYHWYHLRVLRPIWDKPLKHEARTASQLSDVLGDHHDLTVLIERFTGEPERFGGEEAAQIVAGLARDRQAALTEEAKRLGARLFADKPDAIAARFGSYFKVWRRETAEQRKAAEAAAKAPQSEYA